MRNKKNLLGKSVQTKVHLTMHVPFRKTRGQKQEERVREGEGVESSKKFLTNLTYEYD